MLNGCGLKTDPFSEHSFFFHPISSFDPQTTAQNSFLFPPQTQEYLLFFSNILSIKQLITI